ncbi:translation machinery-associated protein 16-like [Penaeus japonicus]|uniref:translation machinery-associated protein 16-like n=1 Tax=Penaeus japonicus TaxID=27405 RepID=UPI001C713649|nr:translation machinery-associated protein 16-like [Penaeus japonicus]
MGKHTINVLKENQKVIHPNSRKAKQLNKKISREVKMKKRRGENNLKLQVLGDKLMWFKREMDSSKEVYAPKDVLDLIDRYIDRNMEELEQITLKHSIGKRNKRQHASRESTIKIVHEQETALFRQSGFETIDYFCPKNVEAFKSWSGEIRFLSNFKLRKYKRKDLEDNLIGEEESSSTAQTEDDAMDDDKEEDTEGVEEGEDNDEDDDDDMEG